MSTMANEQADTAIEADEQLKKRARRRLVGAAALVLLAVIVLPLVMDHEPRPAVPEIQVRIPSPQEAPPFQPKLPAAKSTDAAKEPARPVEPPPAPEPKPQLAPKVEAKPEASPAAPQKPAETGAAAKPADKPAEKTADKSAEARRAEAALGGAPGPSTNGQWVVQLGAYKEAGNVKILLGKIKEMGLPAYTEKFDTPQGPRTRVRAGPFPSKEAAERAQQRIKTIGVSGPVAPK